jgi:hypothetical protein
LIQADAFDVLALQENLGRGGEHLVSSEDRVRETNGAAALTARAQEHDAK